MPKFTFQGPVFPRHIAFSVQEVVWTYPMDNGYKTTVGISFVDHEVRAVVTTDDPEETHLNVYPIARECSQAFAAYLTYEWRVRITCLLETARLEDGSLLHLIERLEDEQDTNFEFIPSASMQRMFADADILLPLRDFATAHDTRQLPAVHYARALEAIRVKLSPGEPDDKKAWAHMRSALRISKTFLTFVTDLSRLPRHGHRTIPTIAENTEMMRRTRAVIDRYVDLIASEATHLPASTPEL